MNCLESCETCPVWEKSLFKDFDRDLLKDLSTRKKFHQFNKGEKIFIQGEMVGGLYCHAEGLTKVIQRDESSRVRFSRLVFPGDTSGHRSLFVQNNFQGTAIALSDNTKVCLISTEDVSYLLSKNVSFAKNLILKISAELNRSEEEKIETKEKTVRNRLNLLLYKLATEHAQKKEDNSYLINTIITKREISQLLLVAEETIIRLMSDMQKDGLVDYQGKYIVIKNIEEILIQTKY